MSNLDITASCLEKIKSKNFGQGPDNLKHLLVKDLNYDYEDAAKHIDEAVAANVFFFFFYVYYFLF